MLIVPRMLLIGSSGRDSGKTTFACRLIEKYPQPRLITAAKVTTVRKGAGPCARGGEGCGVCDSLDVPYCITEEIARGGRKDTQRLLAAGAGRVYWLRTWHTALDDGASALMETVEPHAPLVCESNSLRLAVQPGLFLVFRPRGAGSAKESAQRVLDYADRVITFDGHDFDLALDDVRFVDGKWTLRRQA